MWTIGGQPKPSPAIWDNPTLCWGFIRRVYVIICVELFAAAGVCVAVLLLHRVDRFLSSKGMGQVVFYSLCSSPILAILPLLRYHKRRPVNFFLLVLFIVALALAMGVVCAYESKRIALESIILTAVMVAFFTVYTLWAERRDRDYYLMLAPYLIGLLFVVVAFIVIQIFKPLGHVEVAIISLLAPLIAGAYILYETIRLIRTYTCEDYIWASLMMYFEIPCIIPSFIRWCRGIDRAFD